MTIAVSGAPATNIVVHDASGCGTGHCSPPKPLLRNWFFPRKLMEVRHWTAEQAYHRNARELVTRLGTGSGVLCGLEVTPTDLGTLVISAGVATDGYGRLVVVPEDLEVDPSRVSGPHGGAASEAVTDGVVTVSVCYRECGADPVTIATESCNDDVRTVPSMIRESFCVTVTPGDTVRVGLPEGLCEATRSPGLDAEATRALLDKLDPRDCACTMACVPLATVTYTAGSPEVSTSVRTVIRSNRELLDLILCLAERLDECCGHEPPVVKAPRITSLWPLPDTEGIALKEFGETHLLEIAFDQDMAEQGLNLPEPWLGVWLLPKPALTHIVQASRLGVTRSGSPLTHVTAPPGGDAAVYEVDLPKLRAGDVVLVMVRSTVAGEIRANGATGLALDADLAATTLTEAQRDALWAVAPGGQTARPAAGLVPSPPLPSGEGTAGGDLHLVLIQRAQIEVPPRLLEVDPVGGASTDADWKKLTEDGGFSIVVSRELSPDALDNPKNWLRMWYATLDGDVGVGATELQLKLRDAAKLDGGIFRYTFAFEGLPKFTDHWQVLWQLRSGPSADPGAPTGAATPKLLLDADFAGTSLDSQTLFGLWAGAIDSFPFLTPTSAAGQLLWDGTAGGLAHWGLTTRPI
jgi:hypothetical protein